jgi:hypothetical protein
MICKEMWIQVIVYDVTSLSTHHDPTSTNLLVSDTTLQHSVMELVYVDIFKMPVKICYSSL